MGRSCTYTGESTWTERIVEKLRRILGTIEARKPRKQLVASAQVVVDAEGLLVAERVCFAVCLVVARGVSEQVGCRKEVKLIGKVLRRRVCDCVTRVDGSTDAELVENTTAGGLTKVGRAPGYKRGIHTRRAAGDGVEDLGCEISILRESRRRVQPG